MKIISKFIVCFLDRYNNINIVYTIDKTLVIIQTAGMIVSTDAIKKVDAMLAQGVC